MMNARIPFFRSSDNPLLTPESIPASQEGLIIECLLNPGAFRFRDKIGLLLRVAERPVQKDGFISFPVYDENSGLVQIMKLSQNDPDLNLDDPRVINYKGEDYLTTMSHLCPVFSEDGTHFRILPEYKRLFGYDRYSSYGIEDCRVSQIDDEYLLTYTAVSLNGVGVALKTTGDWIHFKDYGLIFPPHNKDCAIFEHKTTDGKYYAFHRPSSPEIGGNYLWLAESYDLMHWGNYACIARTREGKFDSARLGAGCAPILTDKGWLAIYHGATEEKKYCLGALLLDLHEPEKVLARSEYPIMEPEYIYEKQGFWGEVIFTNGHIVNGDKLTIYYGAADRVICSATVSISEILSSLNY